MKKYVITSGGISEKIDNVRKITNSSRIVIIILIVLIIIGLIYVIFKDDEEDK